MFGMIIAFSPFSRWVLYPPTSLNAMDWLYFILNLNNLRLLLLIGTYLLQEYPLWVSVAGNILSMSLSFRELSLKQLPPTTQSDYNERIRVRGNLMPDAPCRGKLKKLSNFCHHPHISIPSLTRMHTHIHTRTHWIWFHIKSHPQRDWG